MLAPSIMISKMSEYPGNCYVRCIVDTKPIKRLHIEPEQAIRLRINLLGGFQVWIDSRLIPYVAWKRRKVQALVKLLALTSRHCMHREQLMEILWPEADMES